MAKGTSQINIGVNVTGNEGLEKLEAMIQGIKDNVEWVNKNGLNIKSDKEFTSKFKDSAPPGMVALQVDLPNNHYLPMIF